MKRRGESEWLSGAEKTCMLEIVKERRQKSCLPTVHHSLSYSVGEILSKTDGMSILGNVKNSLPRDFFFHHVLPEGCLDLGGCSPHSWIVQIDVHFLLFFLKRQTNIIWHSLFQYFHPHDLIKFGIRITWDCIFLPKVTSPLGIAT